VFSQPVLLALVQAGLTRDDAYRIVQDSAAAAWSRKVPFRSVIEADPRASSIPAGVLDDAFDLARSLVHIGRVFERLDSVRV